MVWRINHKSSVITEKKRLVTLWERTAYRSYWSKKTQNIEDEEKDKPNWQIWWWRIMNNRRMRRRRTVQSKPVSICRLRWRRTSIELCPLVVSRLLREVVNESYRSSLINEVNELVLADGRVHNKIPFSLGPFGAASELWLPKRKHRSHHPMEDSLLEIINPK